MNEKNFYFNGEVKNIFTNKIGKLENRIGKLNNARRVLSFFFILRISKNS